MTIELHTIGRVRVEEEAAGSYGVDLTSSGTYLDVPVQGVASLTLNKQQNATGRQVQYRRQSPKTVLGISSWSMQVNVTMGALGVAANESTASLGKDDSAQLRILAAIFGGISGEQQGSLISDASPTVTEVDVTASEGPQFFAGSACGHNSGASSAFEIRGIEQRSSDTITTSMAFSNAPGDGTTLYNATTIFPTEDPNTSLQFLVEGSNSSDGNAWLLQGGQCTSVGINTPVGELATWSFTFEGSSWTPRASMASAPTFGSGTYSNHNELITEGELTVQTHGTTTRQVIDAQSVTFAPTISFVNQTSVSAAETVARKRAVKPEDFCIATMTLPFEDATWFTARDNGSEYRFQLQLGSVAGSSIAIVLPRAQVHDVQLIGEGEIASQTVTFRSRHDDMSDDERRGAPMRIHFA